MNKITNVAEFLNLISHLDTKQNVFYRGHSNCKYTLEPGIYRKNNNDKTLIQFEDKIFREVISKSPQDFVGKNTLETLALLQHYGAPTRVLDITENSLIALYFACNGNEKSNGEVIIFDIPDDNVCNYDSDRVSILANLSKCDSNFKFDSDFIEIYSKYKNEIEKHKKVNHATNKKIKIFFKENYSNIKQDLLSKEFNPDNFDMNFETISSKAESMNFENEVFKNEYINTIQKILESEISDIIEINKEYLRKLIQYIKDDKPYFEPRINPQDISKVLAVKPKLDNPRIIRQQGAFLIFGIDFPYWSNSQKIKPIAKLNSEWIIKGPNNASLIINHESKGRILSELNSIGLNESTLFPEIDRVTRHIKEKYDKKLNI